MHLIVREVLNLKNKLIDKITYNDTDKYYDIEYLNQNYGDSFYNSLLIVDFRNRVKKLIDAINDRAKFKIKYKNEDQFSDVKKFKFSFLNKNGKMKRYNKKDELDELREYESGMSFSLNIEIEDC